MLSYRIQVEPDDNGTLLVTSPDLPEVTTFGVDEDDARKHAVSAIEEALAARVHDNRDIPSSAHNGVRVDLPLTTALKVALYRSITRKK
jgi:antitoxin HicB